MPSLENLKKRIKQFRKDVRAGDPAAVARVRQFHPRAEEVLADFRLSDAQLVTARAYGLPSWPRLRKRLEQAAPYAFDPESTSPELFVRLACMDYAGWNPSHAARARALLAADPAVGRADLSSASAAGDVDAVRAFLRTDPGALDRKGGPLNWEPLLYACYSRLDTLEVARVLLAAGADPNAGFLWKGNTPPFTALTGAFGEGENGNNEPPHQDELVLARLLLDAGADPNDGQTLYNKHFNAGDGHFRLLFEYGLGTDKGGPWFKRFPEMQSPAAMLGEELWAGAGMNRFERVRLLVEHGADPNHRSFRDGRSAVEAAVLAGNDAIAAYLVAHGGRPVALDPVQTFATDCVAGRAEEARARLRQDPTLVEKLGFPRRMALLHKAVESRRAEAIRLMAALGFELSGLTRNTPMHDAAWAGDLEMVKLLVELGADPNVKDPTHHGTPLGWADHNHQQAVVDYLRPLTRAGDEPA